MMSKKNILILASDFQTICAFELLKKKKINSCIVLPLNQKISLPILSKIYNINYKLISLFNLLIYFFGKNLFVFGNDRGYLFKIVSSGNFFENIIIVNDGTSDILDDAEQTLYDYSFFRKFVLRIITLCGKLRSKTHINYFTFNKKSNYSNHEFNNFSFLKKIIKKNSEMIIHTNILETFILVSPSVN